jgi:hypothetical protein
MRRRRKTFAVPKKIKIPTLSLRTRQGAGTRELRELPER